MPEWITLVTQVGVAGVLAAWVWVEQQRAKVEREERLAVQKANEILRNSYEDRMLKALYDTTAAIRESTEAQRSLQSVIEGLKDLVVAGSRS